MWQCRSLPSIASDNVHRSTCTKLFCSGDYISSTKYIEANYPDPGAPSVRSKRCQCPTIKWHNGRRRGAVYCKLGLPRCLIQNTGGWVAPVVVKLYACPLTRYSPPDHSAARHFARAQGHVSNAPDTRVDSPKACVVRPAWAAETPNVCCRTLQMASSTSLKLPRAPKACLGDRAK